MTIRSSPHRRLNQLTGEWVLVSPHRTARPWQGQVETPPVETRPAYDPTCYLCPGNPRAAGAQTPNYSSTYVFQNDFSALLPEMPAFSSHGENSNSRLLLAEPERGICRVICFSPRHDVTIADMALPELRLVVDVWAEQYEELGAIEWVKHVQIFENRGAMMGASNPHPHGQIWAQASLPNEAVKELNRQRAHYQAANECLLCAYLAEELAAGERIVCANEHFVALVPFWAVWPFETLVLPRAHHATISALDGAARDGLAAILQELTQRYNRLFNVSFPYSMGFHQQPTDGADYPEWHLHAHFYPPLLRSATIRKFMVGYEMLAEAQRDITPEQAAERLRALA